MKERHIKVYESPGPKYGIPRINLQGEWLSNFGYHVGDHIIVSFEQDRIIVEHDPNYSTSAPSQG